MIFISIISIKNMTFYYNNPYKEVFENLNLNIDTSWKTGLIGRNGRGKSTLLNLIQKKLKPLMGSISLDEKISYFPFKTEEYKNVKDFIKNNIAPFQKWENLMDELLKNPTIKNIERYDEIHNMYMHNNGYEIDGLIEKELYDMNMNSDILYRKKATLSGGELTRVMIIILFLKNGYFPLIDEPTNHLDLKGREILAEYLNRKKGFIIVSHDRYFLDKCIDHIIAINKSDIKVYKTNYTEWEYNFEIQKNYERKTNEKLKKQINLLDEASKRSRKWSSKKEKEKAAHTDKGYIGAQSKRLMKQAMVFEQKIEKSIEEKNKLLKNEEKDYDLKIFVDEKVPNNILEIRDLKIKYGEKYIIRDFNLNLYKGQRLFIKGENGSGKTSIINAILNKIDYEGQIIIPAHIKINYASQIPKWKNGTIKENLEKEKLDEQRYRDIIACFNLRGNIWNKNLETFSDGEKKKIEIARSIVEPSGLYIWDEPMNYLDIIIREKIEEAILESNSTMIIIEHDKYFMEKIATNIIEIN
ncbi:ATP-binding cassette domain-containing protein [Oceanotoga sp. DSM 15011]|uniref:ribosomal protection-like ABC-F family protein n=1 Tax=Oceanotoga sp. DSM 15011 TaxID=2984951 RepID=UPI0021F45A40|nr:ATP-binding cassette domain-containing protein [Oceanotoga sp. DSM 15011]UYO99450.1 ATP-binding cassette domain-containing protein [Oceanotoga sp. DSM 15011]